MPDTTDASKLLHSCGAVLYTIKGSRLYVVLGKEGDAYFHFKGCCEPGETYEETAIREVYEETMGLVRIKSIALECESIASKKSGITWV
jgi:ADP-ribose pyrophosphatase YjhB (NUDIX family)